MELYEIVVRTIDGETQELNKYKGEILLIVNVASKCGFTSQYEELEALYRRYRHKGFAVLGFPCDQFAHQEPGNDMEIKSFCSLTYDVTFPLFAKIKVNGSCADPLYKYLKKTEPGIFGSETIKWNFTKFLVNREGKVLKRYAPTIRPKKIEDDLIWLFEEEVGH